MSAAVLNTDAQLNGNTLEVLELAQTVSGIKTHSAAVILQDSVNLTFGTGSDATLAYDGTNLNLNPQVVGSGNLVMTAGSLVFGSSAGLRSNSSDASDNIQVSLASGGSAADTRGGYILLSGNEHASTGQVELVAGNVSGGDIDFVTGGVLRAHIDEDGHIEMEANLNIGMGTTSYGSGTGVIAIANGTQGSAIANQVMLTSEDLSAGNTILSMRTEGSGVVATGTPASADGAIAVKVNGTVRYLTYSDTAPS